MIGVIVLCLLRATKKKQKAGKHSIENKRLGPEDLFSFACNHYLFAHSKGIFDIFDLLNFIEIKLKLKFDSIEE